MPDQNIPDSDDDRKPAHTPGPWAVSPLDRTLVSGRRGASYSNIAATIVIPAHGAERFKIAGDNARLIAAAPDMLKELKIARATIERLVEGIKRRDERQHVNPGFNPDYTTQIDAVIAKAEAVPVLNFPDG